MKFSNNNKNSNIEVFRLVCMFIIMLHHAVLYSESYKDGTVINKVFSYIFLIGGKLGANCFIIITIWFLLSKTISIKKVIIIWMTVVLYGVIFLLINFVLNIRSISIRDILEICFPINYDAYWFVSGYIGLLMISPLLKLICEKVSGEQLRYIVAILLLFVSVPATFFPSAHPFQDTSHISLFILLWFLVAYIKTYISNIHRFSVMISIIGITLIIFAIIGAMTAGFMLKKESLEYASQFWMTGECIPMLMLSVGISFLVLSIKQHNINIINSISSGCFDVYLIHMNHFIYIVIWEWLSINKYVTSMIYPIYTISLVLIVFIICLIIGMIRVKTVGKLCTRFTNFIYDRIHLERVESVWK